MQFNETIPPGELVFRRGRALWEVEFAAENGDWKNDQSFREQLFGVLLLSKLPEARPDAVARMPGWIVAGFDEQRRGQNGPERLLRRNRQLPVIRTLLELGRFPDFRVMTRLDGGQLPEAARPWYAELSRLLLETVLELSTPADNALLDYAVLRTRPEVSEQEAFDATVGRVLLAAAARKFPTEKNSGCSEDELRQKYLESAASSFGWHEYSPRPNRLARAAFEKNAAVTIPELAPDGTPSEATRTIDLAELPALLAEGRPDGAQLRTETVRGLQTLFAGNDSAHNRRLTRLITALEALPVIREEQPTSIPAANFLSALRDMRRYFILREALEQSFEREAFSALPPGERYRTRMREAVRPSPLLTEAEQRFLDQTEARYLEE